MKRSVIGILLMFSLLMMVAAGCSSGTDSQQPLPDSGKTPGPKQDPPAPPSSPKPTDQPTDPPVTPPAPPQAPSEPTGQLELTGSKADLQAALSAPSAVIYKIVVVPEGTITNKDIYLDGVLATRKWPEPDMLVLLIFPADNHDIRFAMGANFRAQNVTVDELLSLVRTLYLPAARNGDPAKGVAELIRAVNAQMTP